MTDQAPPAAIGDDERKLPLVADANGERTELHGHVEAIFGTIRTVVIAFSLLFAVVGGGLGFFGWRTTSDIGATIDASADSRIGRLIEGTNDANASLTRSIEELTSQVTSISDRARRLLGDIESAEQTLQIVDAGLTDPIGDYLGQNTDWRLGRPFRCGAEKESRDSIPKTNRTVTVRARRCSWRYLV